MLPIFFPMSHWDRKLLMKLRNAGSDIERHPILSFWYVNDSNYVGQEIQPGVRLGEDGKIEIVEKFIEQNQKVKGDVRTASIVQKVANSIYDLIKVEIICPPLHDSE